MKKVVCFSFIILSAIFFSGCNYTNTVKTVSIEKIDTSGIYFSYEYLGKEFEGTLPLEITHEDFTSADSLKIRINKNHPEEFKFISVVHRVWNTQDEIVSIGNDENNEDVYSFNQLDKKPLFLGASNEYENDSLLLDFFVQHSNQSDEMELVGVYVLIDKYGDATFKKAFTQNEDDLQVIKTLIDKLPKFTTPIYDGDSVTVSYLIEIPIYK